MTTLPASHHRILPVQQLLMLATFIGMTLLIMPLSFFVYDNDEGINVMKAVLMSNGYPLYTETWSDQPPIFTQLLAMVFTLFGQSMLVARLLVLTLASLFVWAYTGTIRLHLGVAAAWTALLLLMISDNFLRLSLSVMIGLPALSFAMVAIYLLQRSKAEPDISARRLWPLLSAGILMGIAIQTKVFVAFLVPVMALDLVDFGWDWFGERSQFWRKLRNALIFGTVAVATWVAIGLYYDAFHLDMLLGAHLNTNVRSAYEGDGGWSELSRYILFDYGHLLVALAGIVALTVRRQWHGLLPLSWLIVAVILLSNHSPIWYHHYQIVAIPLCWLAAYLTPLFAKRGAPQQSTTESATLMPPTWPALVRIGSAIAFVLALLLTYSRARATIPYYNQRIYDNEVVARLEEDAANTTWVFADQAIYPFYAGLQVPPQIAVFSRKRFYGASLDNQLLLTILVDYRPEQILLTRFKDDLLGDPEFVGYLNAHYTTVEENINYGYYRLKR